MSISRCKQAPSTFYWYQHSISNISPYLLGQCCEFHVGDRDVIWLLTIVSKLRHLLCATPCRLSFVSTRSDELSHSNHHNTIILAAIPTKVTMAELREQDIQPALIWSMTAPRCAMRPSARRLVTERCGATSMARPPATRVSYVTENYRQKKRTFS